MGASIHVWYLAKDIFKSISEINNHLLTKPWIGSESQQLVSRLVPRDNVTKQTNVIRHLFTAFCSYIRLYGGKKWKAYFTFLREFVWNHSLQQQSAKIIYWLSVHCRTVLCILLFKGPLIDFLACQILFHIQVSPIHLNTLNYFCSMHPIHIVSTNKDKSVDLPSSQKPISFYSIYHVPVHRCVHVNKTISVKSILKWHCP